LWAGWVPLLQAETNVAACCETEGCSGLEAGTGARPMSHHLPMGEAETLPLSHSLVHPWAGWVVLLQAETNVKISLDAVRRLRST
jgi:hypothetical protein